MDKFDLGGGRILDIDFATERDERRVEEWSFSLGLREGNPKVRDALELSKLALIRWDEAKAKQRDASDLEDIRDRIIDEPHAEVSGLLVARPLWTNSRQLGVLGVCYFRRTWCHNIVLDYLTIHPAIARRSFKHPKGTPQTIKGVGLALFYSLSSLAVELNVSNIWFEATQNSAPRYSVWFERPDLKDKDLVYLTESDFKKFMEETDKKKRLA